MPTDPHCPFPRQTSTQVVAGLSLVVRGGSDAWAGVPIRVDACAHEPRLPGREVVASD